MVGVAMCSWAGTLRNREVQEVPRQINGAYQKATLEQGSSLQLSQEFWDRA